MLRMIKLATLVVGALGLLATVAPPAHADTYGVAVLNGTATLGGGLSYPVVGGVPSAPVCHGLLPLPTSGTLLTIAGQNVPDLSGPTRCHLNWGGNLRGVTSVASDLCVVADVNVNKLAKPLTHVNAGCGFALAPGKAPEGNHVHGFCGLSGGQVQVTFTDGLGQAYTLDLHFSGLGSLLVITGHWRKLTNTTTQTGKVVALVSALPVPVLTTPTLGNSCAGGTASVFTLTGVAALYPHPITIP